MKSEIQPIKFEEANVTYTAKGCGDLPVHKSGGQIISCWKLPLLKRFKILFTGRVWLSIYGQSQPPVCIVTDYPFVKEEEL